MSVAEIDSEARDNVVETDPQLGPSSHCVVVMEQPPLSRMDDGPPEWRVFATLTIRDAVLFGKEDLITDLPTVVVGPLVRQRQVVAVARYPGHVVKWAFRFASDAGRATARVWLHPGTSPVTDAGIFVVRHGLDLGVCNGGRRDRR